MADRNFVRLTFAVLTLVWGGLAWADPPPASRTAHGTAGPYLGQPLPGRRAVVFAPGVVSLAGRYEYALSVHPAGDRILFTAEYPEGGASVYLTAMRDGAWTPPRQVPLSGGARKNEMEAFFSPDGRSLFFAAFDQGMDVRPWMADVTGEDFPNPRPLGAPVSEDPAFYPVPARDGALFYYNLDERAVYRAVVDDDGVRDAEPLGLQRAGHAFPSGDGSFILVDSASLGSEDQRDIFVSFRNPDGTWGPARALGPEVNTRYSETCPSLSPDGKLLFFSRYDEPDAMSNIYWISSEVIEATRASR